MNDDDILAFSPGAGAAPPAVPATPARRRRMGRWLLAMALLLLFALALAGTVVLVTSLLDATTQGVQVVVDGQPWLPVGTGGVVAALAVAAVLLCVGAALVFGLLVTAVVLPFVLVLVLVLALLGVALCVVLGLAGPLLAVAALVAVLLSPLWLAGLLLWWLRRGHRAPAATMHP